MLAINTLYFPSLPRYFMASKIKLEMKIGKGLPTSFLLSFKSDYLAHMVFESSDVCMRSSNLFSYKQYLCFHFIYLDYSLFAGQYGGVISGVGG